MTKVLSDRELLEARGWRERELGRWYRKRLAANDERSTSLPFTLGGAKVERQILDVEDAREHGSVTYRPTAEQAQVPLLAQAAAMGMTERDVIRELFAAHEEQRRLLLRRAETEPDAGKSAQADRDFLLRGLTQILEEHGERQHANPAELLAQIGKAVLHPTPKGLKSGDAALGEAGARISVTREGAIVSLVIDDPGAEGPVTVAYSPLVARKLAFVILRAADATEVGEQ